MTHAMKRLFDLCFLLPLLIAAMLWELAWGKADREEITTEWPPDP